jgi:hypothetical protein
MRVRRALGLADANIVVISFKPSHGTKLAAIAAAHAFARMLAHPACVAIAALRYHEVLLETDAFAAAAARLHFALFVRTLAADWFGATQPGPARVAGAGARCNIACAATGTVGAIARAELLFAGDAPVAQSALGAYALVLDALADVVARLGTVIAVVAVLANALVCDRVVSTIVRVAGKLALVHAVKPERTLAAAHHAELGNEGALAAGTSALFGPAVWNVAAWALPAYFTRALASTKVAHAMSAACFRHGRPLSTCGGVHALALAVHRRGIGAWTARRGARVASETNVKIALANPRRNLCM